MPKAQRTPGPFYTGADVTGKPTIRERLDRGSTCQMATAVMNRDAERMADLLNKGTHFDGLLAVVKMCAEEMPYASCIENGPCFPEHEDTMKIVRAAIAKAEGTD